jgi:hypothetical protein
MSEHVLIFPFVIVFTGWRGILYVGYVRSRAHFSDLRSFLLMRGTSDFFVSVFEPHCFPTVTGKALT